jgi:hypothetical protein
MKTRERTLQKQKFAKPEKNVKAVKQRIERKKIARELKHPDLQKIEKKSFSQIFFSSIFFFANFFLHESMTKGLC